MLGRNFQVVYEQADTHGQHVSPPASPLASTDAAVVARMGRTGADGRL